MVRRSFVVMAAAAFAQLATGATLVAAKPPVIEVGPAPAPSTDETYGDWTVVRFENGTTVASTATTEGTLGVLCTRAKCTSFLNPKIDCEKDHNYPGLVNSPAAAFSVTMLCEKVAKLTLYSFPLDTGMTEAMSVGGVLGFAFPMQSGRFEVYRFSLTGAARATARASQIAGTSSQSDPQRAADRQSL